MSVYINDPTHPDSNSTPDSGSGPSTSNALDRAGSNEHDDDAGRKKKQGKRRKVNHACLYCRRSHMTCDEGRPCQRWYVHSFGLISNRIPNQCSLPSIKREIGHLCHDERRSTPKEKSNSTPQQTQSQPAPMPNPSIDVARVIPGKHPLFILLRPVFLTLLLHVHSSPIWRTTTSCARPKPGLAEYEPHCAESVLVSTRDIGQRVLCPFVRACSPP